MTVVVNMEANSGRVEAALAKISSKFRGVQSEANQVSKTVDRIGSSRMKLDPTLAELRNVNATLTKTQSNITSTFDSVSSSLKKAAVTLTVALSGAALTTGLTSASDSLTQLQNKLALVTGRTKELNEVQDQLYKIAARTGGSVQGAAELFNKYGLTLKKAGKSTAEILQMTEITQKAFAISGASAESANAAIMQLGQGLASGVLRGEELNSIMEQAAPLAAIFAKQLGTDIGGFRKMAADGKVTAEVIGDAFVNHGSDIEEAFKTANMSIGSGFQQVRDQLTRVIGTFMQMSGLADRMRTTFTNLAGALSKIDSTAIAAFLQKLQGAKAIVGSLIDTIMFVAPSVGNLIAVSMKRIASEMPYVTLPMLNAFEELKLKAEKQLAVVYMSFMKSSASAGVFSEAVQKIFKAKTVLELKTAIDELSELIENNGRRWYNVMNNGARYFYAVKQSFLELGLYLGLFDQKLIRINRSSNATFKDFISILKEVSSVITSTLNNSIDWASIYMGVQRTRAYFSLLVTSTKNSMSDLRETLQDLTMTAVSSSFEKATNKIGSLFRKMVSAIKQVGTSSFSSVVNLFVSGITAIERKFFWLYDQVIGHSWWPDLMDGLKRETDGALPYVLSKLESFKTTVNSFFRDMFSKSSSVDLGSMFTIDTTALKANLTAMAASLTTVIVEAVKSLDAISPIITNGVITGIAAGIVSFFSKGSSEAVMSFFRTSLLLGLAAGAASFSLKPIVDSKVFERIGSSLGTSLGMALHSLIANIPLLITAFQQLASSFGQSLLEALGPVGRMISSFATITGTSGILNTLLFGVGINVLLGNFKGIKSSFNSLMSMFSPGKGKGAGNGTGKGAGLLGGLIFGNSSLLIKGLVTVASLYLGLQSLFSLNLSGVIGSAGAIGLALFGIGGVKGILTSSTLVASIVGELMGSLSAYTSQIPLLGELFQAMMPSGSDPSVFGKMGKDLVEIVQLMGQVENVSDLGDIWTLFREAMGPVIPALTATTTAIRSMAASSIATMSGLMTAAMVRVSTVYTAVVARMGAIASAAGAAGGLFSRIFFGRTARIAAILAAIVALMTGAASAAEAGGSMLAGQSWGDLGMMGLLLLGSGLGGPVLSLVKAVSKKAVDILGGLALSAMSSSIGIVASIGTTVATGLTAGFTGLITGILGAVTSIGAGIVAFFGAIPLAIAAAVAAVAGGIYYWFFSGETEAEKKIAEVKQKAADLKQALQTSFDPAKISKVLEASEMTVNLKALLDTTNLEGMSERQVKNVEVAMKAFDKVAQRNNEILQSEGVLTRAQILEVRNATKAVEAAIKDPPNPAEDKKVTSSLREAVLTAIVPYTKGLSSSAGNSPVGNGQIESMQALDARNRKFLQDVIAGNTKGLGGELTNSISDPRGKQLANLLSIFDTVDLATIDPAIAKKFMDTTQQYLADLDTINSTWSWGEDKEKAKRNLDVALAQSLDGIRKQVLDSFSNVKDGQKLTTEVNNMLAEATDMGLNITEEMLRSMGKETREQLKREMASAKKSGVLYDTTTRPTDGPKGVGNIGDKTDAQAALMVSTKQRLEELAASGTRGISVGIDENINGLEKLNAKLQEVGANFQAEQFVSPAALGQAEELMRSIAEKRQMLLQPLEAKVANGILASIAVDQNAIVNLLGTTEQKLQNVSSIVDGMPDVNDMLYLSNDTINQIVAYGNKILEIMALIKAGGAGPGALNSPVGDSMADQAAATMGMLKNQIKLLAGAPKVTSDNSTGKGKGKGGGAKDAKTWWEEFQSQLSAMNIKLDDNTLLRMNGSAMAKLTKASEKYKAAQEAINKSTATEVEKRKQSLKLMQEARQEAIAALNDGTYGGVKAQLENLGSSIDEAIIGKLTQGQLAYATALNTRIEQLKLERETMAAGSPAAIAASQEIDTLTMKLEEMANSSAIMRDAFEQGLSSFLKGQSSLSDFLSGLLDTFTSTIIDKFSKGFTDSLFNSLGLDQLFTGLFQGATEFGSSTGLSIGGKLGSTPMNAMWVQNADGNGLLGGLGASDSAAPSGGGMFGGLNKLFSSLFSGIGGFFKSLFGGLFGGMFAGGGKVSGPGSGTSDSILAGLSDGEFVVNAASTKKWLPMLEAINSNSKLPRFATGGRVGPSNPGSFKAAISSKSGQASTSTFEINITGDVSQQTRKEIVAMIPQIAGGVNNFMKEKGSR